MAAVYALAVMLVIGQTVGTVVTVLAGLLVGAVTSGLLLALSLLKSRQRAMGTSGETLKPGAVLESGFGPDSFVIRGPMGATELRYDALASVVPRDDWVLFSVRDRSGFFHLPPRALFSEAALARLQRLRPAGSRPRA